MVLGRCANRFELGLSGDYVMKHGADLDSLDRWIDEREYRNRSIKTQQQQQRFTCWHCGNELIWGADFDMEDVNDGEESDYDFYSTFTCSVCESYVEVFHKCQ